MQKYGYIRISSKDQNLTRQLESLIKFGNPEENIYIEKKTGKNFDRENYQFL
uniref:recombinase family protein n=1 Tax=Neobacillus sp. FSL H8-0543 TaxID=2954672 RepID=UPI00406BFE87